MMSYCDIPMPLRCLIILGLFLLVCLGGYLLPSVYRRKQWMTKVLLPLAMIVCAVPMVIYTADARGQLRDVPIPGVSRWLCQKPLVFPVLLILLVMAYFGHLMLDERRYRSSTITRFS